jgi:thioredoxin-related protein
MKLRLLTTTFLATLGLNAATAALTWTEDFTAAKETASKEKKDLLIDFTGSDWCGWCIKLRSEVFDKPEFEAAAPKSFVLVELDYPQTKAQDEKIKAQNKILQETYAIEGFPSVILADATGRAYAKTGYAPGGPDAYLKSLDELRAIREKRDAAFTKAEKAEGMEKAKAIDEGLKALDSEILFVHYVKELETIISLDKDDSLGRKKGLEMSKASKALELNLQKLFQEQKLEEFEKTVEEFVTKWKLEGEDKQRALMNKFHIFGPDKLDKADALADEISKIAPDTTIGQQVAGIKKQIASMRKKSAEPAEEKPAKAEK